MAELRRGQSSTTQAGKLLFGTSSMWGGSYAPGVVKTDAIARRPCRLRRVVDPQGSLGELPRGGEPPVALCAAAPGRRGQLILLQAPPAVHLCPMGRGDAGGLHVLC